MEEIKFRGKRVNNGEWVYGWYYESVNYFDGSTKPMIIWINQVPSSIDRMIPAFEMIEWEVIPETVGQYTGLKDKNGKEIYKGDVLRALPNGIEFIGEVYYEDAQWFGAKDYLGYAVVYSGAEVIGNVYENVELLTVC